MFRKRYLDTHERYLGSISDIIIWKYNGSMNEQECELIVEAYQQNRKHNLSIPDDPDEESLHFRNLRNAWYHECSLWNPADRDTRVKFAAWKIIESYYAIYAGASSLVRCLYPDKERKFRHADLLNVYANELVSQKKYAAYFLTPADIFIDQQGQLANEELLNQWDYGRENKVPNVKECLLLARGNNKGRTTLLHYFKKLREWATYEDSYLFFRLYGDSVKSNLDRYLRHITFFYLTLTEIFLIDACGWDAMRIQYESFVRELTNNLQTEDSPLISRFATYGKMFG